MSKVVYISPGAQARGYTTDAAASSPLSPIRELHARLSSAEKAIALLCMEPDDAGGSRDPESGAVDDSDPEQDFHPASERERVQQQLEAQRRYDNGPSKRADAVGDELPDTPADINNKNRQFWQQPKATPTMSAMGSPGTTPSPGAGREAEAFVGGRQAGTISGNSSRTAETLRMGETFGTTQDAHLRRVMATQDARTASTLKQLNAAHRDHYNIPDIHRDPWRS